MFKSFSRKIFWKFFFILSAWEQLLFLKTFKPSSRYEPMPFYYFYLKGDQVKNCQQAHIPGTVVYLHSYVE